MVWVLGVETELWWSVVLYTNRRTAKPGDMAEAGTNSNNGPVLLEAGLTQNVPSRRPTGDIIEVENRRDT